MRNVLITGAAGFLGRHFLKKHLELGDRIYAIDDMSAEHSYDILDEAVMWYRQDVESALRGAKTLPEFNIAYHFASPVGGRLRIEYDPFFNMDAFRQDSSFFRWAANARPYRVVYPSSSAVYPVQFQTLNDKQLLHENMVVVNKGRLGNPDATYGFTKLSGEHMAYTLSRFSPGTKVLVIRPFSGYGPGQPDDYPMTAIAKRALAKQDPLLVWGTGRQVRDWIHVDDIVKFVTSFPFVENRIYDGDTMNFQVRNIGTGVGTSFLDLATIIANEVGYSPEIASLVTKPEGVQHRVAMTNAVYNPIPLKEGIKSVLESL